MLKWSSGHFVSCGVLDADGQLQLRFARDSAVAIATTAACVAHARAVQSFDFGEDEERQRVGPRSSLLAPPPAQPKPAHRRLQSAARPSAAAAAMQGVDAALQAVDAAAQAVQSQGRPAQPRRPSPLASPPERQPTAAQVAAPGPLYEFVSFSNVPQWVGMCSTAFNAYRVASESRDSERHTQAIIDLLLLPERALAKLPRGAGSKRAAGRLVSTIKARCRDVGAQLRHRTGCIDPADRNVQLGVHTAAGHSACCSQ